ncbi:MAG: ABC transporter permease [Candidatus Aminicenantes bacterium]|nr:ABC transporter permease [Candidatus Aminicenantes bacterium]
MKRFRAVIAKEFRHLLRDPRSLAIVFAMPLVQIFIFGYAISFDLEDIPMAAVDFDRSQPSAELVRIFARSGVFVLKPLGGEGGLEDAERALRSGAVKQVLIIPPDYAERIREGRTADVGLLIDGSDSNVAVRVFQHSEILLQRHATGLLGAGEVFRVGTKVYFNPESKSVFFFMPGLVAVILLMISALITSSSISRERETGSVELLFISPLRSAEIVVGKTLPYVLVALAVGGFILLFSHFWFGVPFRGNFIILLVFALLYVLAGLSFGILVSTVASTQRTAVLGSLLATLLPSILLSGFTFPLDSLSPVLRGLSLAIPATHFLRIIRGVVVKGAELRHFLAEGLFLAGLSVLLLGLAAAKFAALRRRR